MDDQTARAPGELTEEERLFLLEYVRNGANGAAAARVVGVAEKSASSWATSTLRKPRVKRCLREMLSRAGLTDELIFGKIHHGLAATKATYVRTNKDGKKELLSEPDWNAIVKILDIVCKIRGDYAPTRHKHEIFDPLAGLDEAQKDALLREAQEILGTARKESQKKPEGCIIDGGDEGATGTQQAEDPDVGTPR